MTRSYILPPCLRSRCRAEDSNAFSGRAVRKPGLCHSPALARCDDRAEATVRNRASVQICRDRVPARCGFRQSRAGPAPRQPGHRRGSARKCPLRPGRRGSVGRHRENGLSCFFTQVNSLAERSRKFLSCIELSFKFFIRTRMQEFQSLAAEAPFGIRSPSYRNPMHSRRVATEARQISLHR
jgi:hypothetical protein